MRTLALVLAIAAASLWPAAAPKTGGFDFNRAGRLAVLHEGRVKPLDSVARVSLLLISGRQSLRVEGKRLQAVEWVWEVLARPEGSDAMRLFTVDEPQLLALLGHGAGRRRLSFLEIEPKLNELSEQARAVAALDGARRGVFENALLALADRVTVYQKLKNTVMIEGSRDFDQELAAFALALPKLAKAISSHSTGKADAALMKDAAERAQRYNFLDGAAEFRAVPPRPGENPDDWHTMGAALFAGLSEGALDAEAARWAKLAASYRRGDAAGFNAALGEPTRAPSARAEALFNRASPFTRTMALYVLAFLAAAAAWLGLGGRGLELSRAILSAAVLAHTAGLAARILIHGRPPVTNLYSSAIFVGWAAAAIGLFIERRSRDGVAGSACAATGFASLIVAHHLAQGETMEMMRAVLDSNFWLATHVITITLGYAGAFFASALGHAWLLRRRFGAARGPDAALSSAVYGSICFSLFFSFVGTVLGGIWADQSWGRFWGWDPKENGALLLVLWQALILHARWGGFIRERGLMLCSIGGGIVTALAWFGVNMLGVGLHSYGFMSGAGQALFLFIVVELAAVAAGARERVADA